MNPKQHKKKTGRSKPKKTEPPVLPHPSVHPAVPDLMAQAPPSVAPAQPPHPAFQRTQVKFRSKNVPSLVAEGESALRLALAKAIEEMDSGLSPFCLGLLVDANLDEGRLGRVVARFKRDYRDMYNDATTGLSNRSSHDLAMLAAALTLQSHQGSRDDFWKDFQTDMEPIIYYAALWKPKETDKTLANYAVRGEAAIKSAILKEITEADSDISPLGVELLIHANLADSQFINVWDNIEDEYKEKYKGLQNENSHTLAMISAGFAVERHPNDPTEFWEDFKINMKPLITLKDFFEEGEEKKVLIPSVPLDFEEDNVKAELSF